MLAVDPGVFFNGEICENAPLRTDDFTICFGHAAETLASPRTTHHKMNCHKLTVWNFPAQPVTPAEAEPEETNANAGSYRRAVVSAGSDIVENHFLNGITPIVRIN